MTAEQFTTFERIIQCFSSLKGLALWSYWPHYTRHTNPMPVNFSHFPNLTLLSLCTRTIHTQMEFLPAGISLPITHITWEMDCLSELDTFLCRGRFPHLTHIRASWLSYWNSPDESQKADEQSRTFEILFKILQREHIRCFAMADLESEENLLKQLIANYPRSEKAKIVLLPDGPIPNVQDWVNTAWGDDDTWVRADRGIREQQQIEAL
ncbi:hypothetical protein DL96DRAFT_1559830 [Flagelloscypha sp. PMI_526]|nr:hypothetical protein DL96DRAFT_1559830 [Flagelloscypha sp. PMI_526]